MSRIVDSTYFIGEINLPTDNANYINKLNRYIDTARSKYLLKGLGYELYSLFITELPTPTSERFTDLLNGKEYTDSYGKPQKWTGLANAEKESFLAYFAAYQYSYSNQNSESGTGAMQTLHENAERVSPADFQVNAYNKGVDHYNEMIKFLNVNYETYPEASSIIIKKINWAGI